MFQVDGNRLIFRNGAEKLWIEPWGENSLRVRATKCGEMPERDWALIPPEPDGKCQIKMMNGEASIRAGKLEARLSKSGKISFYKCHYGGFDMKRELLLEEYVRTRRNDITEFKSALEVEAREFKPIMAGDYELTMRFESDPSEKLYGMGQYQQPYLNIKGCEFELAQRNSQASVPFVISSKGYGMLWHNPAIGRAVFAKNLTEWYARSTDILDYWITAGDEPREIAAQYAAATGHVPMMPEFAMGFWQCKLRYQTQEELLTVAQNYHEMGVPVGVIVVDFFHWPHQGDWKFDERYWPDPEGMIKELRDMGITLMVSIWPTVDVDSENYPEMAEKGLLIRSDRGENIAMTFQGNSMHFDATNPEAREFVWNTAKKNYYDKGIPIFWLDEAEPEYDYYDHDHYRYFAGPCAAIGNIYPQHYARAFYEGMTQAGQENVINLIRCAWAGSQRYGALVWSGDIHSSFTSMKNQFAAGLSMAVAGIPWWTTDIGGFHGGFVDDPEFQEVLIRWFEWGAYCPVMRLHGDREPHTPPIDPDIPGGGHLGSGGPNEIWSYGEENCEIMKKYIFRREQMRPYIRKTMQQAHETGMPVIRPLFYGFPGDKAAWECEDEYLFGDSLLVAPVMEAGVRERAVYLPAGADWVDMESGATYAGGQTVTVPAPLDVIPVFRNAAHADLF